MKKNYIKPSSNVYTIEVSTLIAESILSVANNTSDITPGEGGYVVGEAREASTDIWDQEW